MLNTASLLIGLAIVFFLCLRLIDFNRKKRLERKKTNYGNVLQQAHRNRMNYIKVLTNMARIKRDLEAKKQEMSSGKAQLNHIRSILRDLLCEMRKIGPAFYMEKIDIKLHEKNKEQFRHYWEALNDLRIKYNCNLAIIPALKQTYQSLKDQEKRRGQEWFDIKEIVLSLYKELSHEIQIDNPRDVLSLNVDNLPSSLKTKLQI